MAVQARQVSPQERAAMFNQLTRRNWQNLGTRTVAENGTVSFDLPKARLLKGLKVMVEATVRATHASLTTYAPHEDAPFNFLRRAEVSINNGFSPFSISGQSLQLYNISLNDDGVQLMARNTVGRHRVVQGLVSSAGGVDNIVRFGLELPVMVNPRDPVGLVLLQNEETLVTVNFTVGTRADLAPDAAGFTYVLSNIRVTLLSDTFTIPVVHEAFPDISILKLVHERTETVIAGENIIRLPIGLTYRKLGFIHYTAAPIRATDANITSPIELIFNQAEIPYRILPQELANVNTEQYGAPLPMGMFMFDFSDNGKVNLGSARDYVDTERLTEFWLKFNSSIPGTVRIMYEALSRLR